MQSLSKPTNGVLLLYSTSPAPHERFALDLAARKQNRMSTTPIHIVVLQTPQEQSSASILKLFWQHFGTQGAFVEMIDVGISTRSDANDPRKVQVLREADLILVTGGSPERAYRELEGTLAVPAMAEAVKAGTVLAGCSAGAMIFGNGMLSNIQGKPQSVPFLGWIANCLVAPHFGAYDIKPWQEAFPSCWVLGIPNDAMALVEIGSHIESLGPEKVVILPKYGVEPILLAKGKRWAIEY